MIFVRLLIFSFSFSVAFQFPNTILFSKFSLCYEIFTLRFQVHMIRAAHFRFFFLRILCVCVSNETKENRCLSCSERINIYCCTLYSMKICANMLTLALLYTHMLLKALHWMKNQIGISKYSVGALKSFYFILYKQFSLWIFLLLVSLFSWQYSSVCGSNLLYFFVILLHLLV